MTSNIDKTSNIGLGITALVFGIVGLLAWIIPIIGLPIGVVALVLGILGIKKSNIGIYLNDEMISNPTVMDAISGGNCQISNMESYESAEQLATLLKSTEQ